MEKLKRWKVISIILLQFILRFSTATTVSTEEPGLQENMTSEDMGFIGYSAYVLLAESVARGETMALDECQYQFKWRKWNCPERDWQSMVAQSEHRKGTREVAFMQSIYSAGLMYMITQKCSAGTNAFCQCTKGRLEDRDTDFVSFGCSDNFRLSDRLTKLYLNDMVTGNDAAAAMRIQNYGVGRKAVKYTSEISCRCHGLTFSCNIKTCWKQLRPFRATGNYLAKQYQMATHVPNILKVVKKYAKDMKGKRGKKIKPRKELLFSDKGLVYTDLNPVHCFKNTSEGIEGVRNRECLPGDPSKPARMQTHGENSCFNMCGGCGHEVLSGTRVAKRSCDCKFLWCCNITCKMCNETEVYHYCGDFMF